jgi:hypothetical protein
MRFPSAAQGRIKSAQYFFNSLLPDDQQTYIGDETEYDNHKLECPHKGIHDDRERILRDRNPFRLNPVDKIGRQQNKQYPDNIDAEIDDCAPHEKCSEYIDVHVILFRSNRTWPALS